MYTTWPETECADGCLLYTGGSPSLCTERQLVNGPESDDWMTDLHMFMYNIVLKRWTRLQWHGESPRPPGRGFATLTEYQNQAGETAFFLVGGSDPDDRSAWELMVSSVLLTLWFCCQNTMHLTPFYCSSLVHELCIGCALSDK